MSDAYSLEMVGHEVGSYRIIGMIGRGGMGAVYSAEHTLLGRRAAVKFLLPERCRSQEVERNIVETGICGAVTAVTTIGTFEGTFGSLPIQEGTPGAELPVPPELPTECP